MARQAPVSDSRVHALTMIGVCAPGREVRGLEVDRDGVAMLRLSGGTAIEMRPDGELDWHDDQLLPTTARTMTCPDCRGEGTVRDSPAFPVTIDCPGCDGRGEIDV